MGQIDTEIIKKLTGNANQIIKGSYDQVESVFQLTDTREHPPEITELAEAFGMMTVKVEARELALGQKIDELQVKNQTIEELSNIRSQLTSLFINIIITISLFIIGLGIIRSGLIAGIEIPASLKNVPVLEMVLLVIVLKMVFKSGLPLKVFGLNLTGWKHSMVESIVITSILAGLIILLKYYITIHYPSVFRGTKFIDFNYFDYTYITYLFVAPLQEFITRGTVQGSLGRLFNIKHSGFWAIITTNLLFSAFHMYMSVNLSIASFVFGLIWGWMYERHKTIAGVGFSHFMVGNLTGLMGFWNFL